jgi:uncharacterized protein YodC (DUF2158 family)
VACEKFDVVRLKSSGSSGPSGPNMTVLDVSDYSGVHCCWFDRGKLREKVFPDEALVKAAPSNVEINIDLS